MPLNATSVETHTANPAATSDTAIWRHENHWVSSSLADGMRRAVHTVFSRGNNQPRVAAASAKQANSPPAAQ